MERRPRSHAVGSTPGLIPPGERNSMLPSVLRVPAAWYEAIQHRITVSP
jgi:hypothetical protein